MKKKLQFLSLLLAFAMLLGLLPTTAFAEEGHVEINETNFPDAIFRENHVRTYDTDGDGFLSAEEIAAVIEIDCSFAGITSLQGIGYFTALKFLYCCHNQLTSLDVRNNTALRQLWCFYNQLTSLDVSSNTALTDLECESNQLTSLDVSSNTALESLNCDYNQLTSLDVSKNTALTYLNCGANQLTSLDVRSNTELTSLSCGDNQLTSLDVRKNTVLEYLYCDGNQLTSLDVSNNTELVELYCGSNQLTSLDVSKNTALTYLDCLYNAKQITLNADRTFDLTTLPGYFDVTKASNWVGGTVEGNILTVDLGCTRVTYNYDTEMGDTSQRIVELFLDVQHFCDFTQQHDETKHWMACECGEKGDEGEHTFGDWTVTKEATDTQKGEKQRTCTFCDYVQTAEIPELNGSATEDDTNLLLWAALLLVGTLGAVTIVFTKKRFMK